jgi:phenylpropionate dioxygenase-like ring-hydroxylating dioxygenase large terminal subunit
MEQANIDLDHIRRCVDDRPEESIFRVHSDVYNDPRILELEIKYIFERTWNFIGLESQLANANDFITGFIARTPILVTRDAQGALHGLVNACRHKGAAVCRTQQGNARLHVCPYHGWAYDATGKNVAVIAHATGEYPASFDHEDHGLHRIAKLETYNGLIFGSLSADVPPLKDSLGDMCKWIDLVMDQGPHGMEAIPGRVAYTYDANWKLQLENGLDSYHLATTHISFTDVQARRRKGAGNQAANAYDWAKRETVDGGTFTFPNGHSSAWMGQAEPQKRQIYPVLDEVRARVGDAKAQWMLNIRQMQVFPNMQFTDGSGLMLRTYRPLSVDKTEMRGFCLAPIGERADLRAARLRQFEDFFNPSGMATPDDAAIYAECQTGFAAKPLTFLQGYARGMAAMQDGPNDEARSLGTAPVNSVVGSYKMFNEIGMHAPYREWFRLISAGLAGAQAAKV